MSKTCQFFLTKPFSSWTWALKSCKLTMHLIYSWSDWVRPWATCCAFEVRDCNLCSPPPVFDYHITYYGILSWYQSRDGSRIISHRIWITLEALSTSFCVDSCITLNLSTFSIVAWAWDERRPFLCISSRRCSSPCCIATHWLLKSVVLSR